MALIIREDEVRQLITMPQAVEWVESGLRELAEGRARNIARRRVKLPNGWLHVLAAGNPAEGAVGLKSYTTFAGAARFLTLLYSSEDGSLLALVESDYLGMMRTGAASGVATRYMARGDADVMALFGTGWQARGQLLGAAAVRELREVRVYGRDPERRQSFAREMSELAAVNVRAADSAEAALDGALIVATATSSRTPVVPSVAVTAGAHVNAAGSNSLLRREIEEQLVLRAARVVVDTRSTAEQESGDLFSAVEKGVLEWAQLPELGEVVAGRAPGRTGPDEITIFESHGLGIEDITVAAHVYRLAREAGLGQEVPLHTS